jgi:OOP family OmpA-OmpF porin
MLRPFVTAGVGLEMGSFPAVDTRDFGPNFGLGLHAYLWENWGLRLDGRWAPVHVNATPSVGTPINDGWQSNLEATVGVFYAFGGAKDEEPAPAPAPEPEPEPGDQDGDGVNDEKDECPDTPRGATVDEKGCPSDSDGDGVFDGIDKCPDTPKGTEVDAMGCPKVSKARGVLKGVTFKFGSAELTDTAKVTLDEVAKTLNEFPNVKVEVQGHTDSTGPDAVNEHLSQNRANSVMEYLGTAGVAKERLRAKGYGETKPIADNATRDGRSENRRVQLDWLDE